MLVRRYLEERGTGRDIEIRAEISRAVDSSPTLRNERTHPSGAARLQDELGVQPLPWPLRINQPVLAKAGYPRNESGS